MKAKSKSSKRARRSDRPVQSSVEAEREAPAVVPGPEGVDAVAQSTERTIVLASHCTLKDVAALKGELCEVAEDCCTVTLDVRALERVDTAAVQLLCAFVRERQARERAVEWLGEPATLREAARLLGMEPLLALPEAR
ncbi:MAG TPA: STAS domain-containing protein [Steroidobacter sp.]|jgi:ABC-type transporter Mla MlaB component|nr:STAS domain-containing protein [Steroidobacteraceae bacterium]HLS82345.1 STAS domain-containing protein [Steroidobacter sp.]